MIPGLLAWIPLVAAPDTLREYVLDPIVVRGEPWEQTGGPWPAASAHLDRADLERRPGATLAEVLGSVAGVRVASRGVASASGAVSIRGSTTDQVLLLVDGRRLAPAQGGGADPSAIPLEAVESVDVVRGGASAIWGSDAIGGAVLVRTRRARDGLRVRAAAGSFGERRLAAESGWRLGEAWRLRAAVRTQSTEGTYDFEHDGLPRRVENGDSRRDGGEARAEGTLAGTHVTLDAALARHERGVPGSAEFPSPSARLDAERASAGVALRDAGGAWRGGLDLSWLAQTQQYREDEATFGPLRERHENGRMRIEGSLARVVGPSTITAVSGLTADRLASTTDGARRRDAADLRLSIAADLDAAGVPSQALAALRLDAVDGWTPVVSPRVGLASYVVPGVLRIAASAGTSFRVPSFDELFWPPRASAAGNPDLRRERGRDVDAEVALGRLPFASTLSVSAFARGIRDLIQWMPGADGVWRPRNVGEAHVAGLEVDARGALRHAGDDVVRLAASATWLFTEDRSREANVDGRELPYRPRTTGSFSAIFPAILGGELEASLRATSPVFVTRANTKSLQGYAIADLRWRRPLGAGLAADLLVSNLRDANARDFRDYPLPGRSLVFGIDWEGRPW